MAIENFPRHRDKVYNYGVWSIIDSTIKDYIDDFRRLGEDAIESVFEQVSNMRRPVIIDLLASPAAVKSLVEYIRGPQCKPKTLAVGCGYKGDKIWSSPFTKLQNQLIEVSYVKGDLGLGKSSSKAMNEIDAWNEIQKWLGKDTANLIMSRGYGGLHYISTSPLFYRLVAHRLWNMLDPDGGNLLLQLPPLPILEKRGIFMERWLSRLDRAGIENHYVPEYISQDQGNPYGLLHIKKNPRAFELPDVPYK